MAIASLPAPRGAKAAIVLCAAGEPIAARLLARLAPEELRRLDELASGINSISLEDLSAIVDEFAGTVSSTVGLQSGAANVARLIQTSLNPAEVANEPLPVAKAGVASAKELLEALSNEDFVELIANEPTPIAKAVLALVSSVTAAAALEEMPAELRLILLRGMLMERPMTGSSRALLEASVCSALSKAEPRASGKEQQVRIANIVNRLDEKQVTEFVLDLEAANPETAASIRGLLFTFQDIGRLSAKARASLFDKIPAEQMVVALQGSDAGLRDLILSSLTARGRRMIEAELGSRAAAPVTDIKAAKRGIADLALDMGSRGEIELPTNSSES